MNCSALDRSLSDADDFLRGGSDVAFAVTLTAVLCASGVLLVFGEHTIRLMTAIVGGLGGGIILFGLSRDVVSPCEMRLVVAGVSGLVCSLFGLFLYNKGVFLVGAAGVATVTHFVYAAFQPPAVAWHYYVAMSVASLLGGFVLNKERKSFVRLCSSLLGAGGVVLSAHWIHERASNDGQPLPPWLTVFVLLTVTLAGVGTQHWLAVRRKKHRPTRKKEEIVPIGRPVS